MYNETFARASGFLLLLFLLSSQAHGQLTSPAAAGEVNKDEILLLINLTATELKFDVVPTVTVTFPGTHERTKIWVTDRQNLPDKVEPGVTYRNIGIQLRIASRFADIDRIVAEALGEIPKSDAETPDAKSPAVSAVPPIPSQQRAANSRRQRKGKR